MILYIAALVILLAAALICFLTGLKKGLYKNLVKLVKTAVSLFVSIPVAGLIGKNAVGAFEAAYSELAGMPSAESKLYTASSGIFGAIGAAVAFPLVFVIAFAVLSIIALFFGKLIKKLEDRYPFKPTVSKWLGASINAFCGLVAVLFIFTPLAGLCYSADKLVSSLDGLNIRDDEGILDTVKDNSKALYAKPVTSVTFNVIQKPVYKAVTAFETPDGKYNLCSLVESISGVMSEYKAKEGENTLVSLLSCADSMLENIQNDKLLCSVTASFLSDCGKNFRQDKSYLGIDAPDVSDSMKTTAEKIYARLENATPEKLSDLLKGIRDLLSVVEDHPEIIKKIGTGSPEEILLDKSLVTDLVAKAKTNEETSELLEDITEGVISAIADKIKEDPVSQSKDAEEIINGTLDIIKTTLNDKPREERKEQIENGVVKLLEDNKLRLTEDSMKILSSASESVVEYFGDEAPTDIKSYELLPVLSDAMEKLGITYENGQLIFPDGIQ